jgi:Flp pilus assembly protein TadD
MQRGAVFALKGRMEEARKEFAEAAQIAPQTNLPYVGQALLLIQQSEFAEAAEILRRRRAVSPKDYQVAWIFAEALSQLGAEPGTENEKEAVRALEDAVAANFGGAPVRALLGKFLARRGDLAEAARHFEEALKQEPADRNAAYQLAMIYRRTGQNPERAAQLFEQVQKATQAGPGNPAEAARRALVRIIRDGSN